MCIPGTLNSDLIIKDNELPTIAEKIPNIIYNIPISFALVEHSHLIKGK